MRILFFAVAILVAGSAMAQTYETGVEAARHGDWTTAYRAWKPLAERGDARAQYILGVMYDEGRSVPRSDTEAVRWFRMAAQQGYGPAQNSLGACYIEGRGVAKDDATAVRWIRMAAQQGDAFAQFNLGTMYFNGQGMPKNYSESAHWYRMAAERGFALAQFNLGTMYFNGQGVPKNYSESALWHRLAAEQGDPDAQYYLGLMYLDGQGVPEDAVLAYKWIHLALAQGQTEAEEFQNVLLRRLSGEQIAEAKRLSNAFRPKSQSILSIDYISTRPTPRTPYNQKQNPPPRPDALTMRVQIALASIGYDVGPTDGIVGNRTRTAVSNFQKDNGINVTGEVTEELLAQIKDVASRGPTQRERRRLAPALR